MKAIILAAGYATRLYPLTANTPKPLLKVAGAPIIDYTLEKIGKVKCIDHVFVVTNEKFHAQFEDWRVAYTANDKIDFDLSIINDKTLDNDSRLGPIGDVVLVIEKAHIQEDLFVIAGDNLFELDLEDMDRISRDKDVNMLGVCDMGVIEKVREKYGVVIVDRSNRVVAFEEKPKQPKSTLAAAAIYLFKKSTLPLLMNLSQRIPATEANAGDMIKELLAHRCPIQVQHLDVWFDIGTKDELAAAQTYYSSIAHHIT